MLPYCFGETQQRIPFHLNVDPTTNSLYLLNEDMKDAYLYQYYPLYGPFDFVFGDVIRSEKTIEVDVVSMDYLYKDKKSDFTPPPPDILSIDAQGASYEILKGAERVLQETTVAVCCEAEFLPVYKGEKLFGDIVELLDRNGFFLYKFLRMNKISFYPLSIDLRGDGVEYSTDALFLKKIDYIAKESVEIDVLSRLYKCAYIALAYGFVEYAIQCMEKIQDLSEKEKIPNNYYTKLLNKFYIFVQQSQGEILRRFPEAIPEDSNKRRFSSNLEIVDFDAKQALKKCLILVAEKAVKNNVKEIVILSYKKFESCIQEDKNVELVYIFLPVIPELEKVDMPDFSYSFTEDQYVLITASHKNEILKKMVLTKGGREENIFYTGLYEPKNVEEKTPIEQFLEDNKLQATADIIRKNRKQQSYKINRLFE